MLLITVRLVFNTKLDSDYDNWVSSIECLTMLSNNTKNALTNAVLKNAIRILLECNNSDSWVQVYPTKTAEKRRAEILKYRDAYGTYLGALEIFYFLPFTPSLPKLFCLVVVVSYCCRVLFACSLNWQPWKKRNIYFEAKCAKTKHHNYKQIGWHWKLDEIGEEQFKKLQITICKTEGSPLLLWLLYWYNSKCNVTCLCGSQPRSLLWCKIFWSSLQLKLYTPIFLLLKQQFSWMGEYCLTFYLN